MFRLIFVLRAFLPTSLLLLGAVSFTACSVYRKFSSPPKTFLDDVDIDRKLDNLPFQHSWVWIDRSELAERSVFIRPVRVDLLPEGTWKESLSTAISSQREFQEEVQKLAVYFKESIVKEMERLPDRRWNISDQPGPGVAEIEIAFTELQFSHPVARAATYVSPIPGTGAALSSFTDPHVAFAMRITDSESGNLIATIADRKFSPARIVDLNKLTATSSAREICSNWAKMIVESFQKGHLEKVENRGVFSILPW